MSPSGSRSSGRGHEAQVTPILSLGNKKPIVMGLGPWGFLVGLGKYSPH